MKHEIKLALSAMLVAGLTMVSPAFGVNHPSANQFPGVAAIPRLTRQSVIKVHTDHGVIILAGDADPSWDELENAVFVADSIADFEFANSGIPWRVFD